MVNLGGGFPARYVRKTPKLESYGKAIFRSLRKHFGNALPETIVEPGRGLRTLMQTAAPVAAADAKLTASEASGAQYRLSGSRRGWAPLRATSSRVSREVVKAITPLHALTRALM